MKENNQTNHTPITESNYEGAFEKSKMVSILCMPSRELDISEPDIINRVESQTRKNTIFDE